MEEVEVACARLEKCVKKMDDMVGLMAVQKQVWTLLPSSLNPWAQQQIIIVHGMFAREMVECEESSHISLHAELSRMWDALHNLERWLFGMEWVNDRVREVFGVLRTSGHSETWFQMTRLPKLFNAVYKKIMDEFAQGLLADDHRSLIGNALLTCAFVHGLEFDDLRNLKGLLLVHGLNSEEFPLDDFWNPRDYQGKMALSNYDAAMRMLWQLRSDQGRQLQQIDRAWSMSQHEKKAFDALQAGQTELHRRMMADDSFFDPTDDIVCELLGMLRKQKLQIDELVAHMWKERM